MCDEDDDEVVVLGTALPPLAEDEVVSRKPDLDLTVRDAQGRRRFHGAFTGGFSAGHYMTVGSEEGFTPQQYVSTRQQKWDQSLLNRKPEQYMDSEDMDVFGIAPKRITTRDQFAQQGFAGFRTTDTLIDVLKSVIKPSVESIGLQLYKRMKRNAKNDAKNSDKKVYGCDQPFPSTTAAVANEDSLVLYKPKSDFHGIGYKPIAEDNDGNHEKDLSGVSATISGRRLKITGEAFGYGVLDDDIEDDAIVYHKDDISQYDYEIGSVSKNKRKAKPKSHEVLGSDVIDGFVKCFAKINLMDIMTKKYPIPEVPKHWKSGSTDQKVKKSRWDLSSNTTNNTSGKTNDDKADTQKNKAPVLNANIRAILLGEEVVHRFGVKKPNTESKSSDSLIGPTNEQKIEKSKEKPVVQKPLTGFWANKFERSSAGYEDSSLMGGLTEFKDNESVETNESETKDKTVPTVRTTYEWHPHNLLCKRFNIPHPFPQFPDVVGVITVGKSDVRNRTSRITDKKCKTNIFESLIDDRILSKTTQDLAQESSDVESKVFDNSIKANDLNKDSEEEEEEGNDEETTRPPMDLFKAIFASDEESDDEEVVVRNESIENSQQNDEKSNETIGDLGNNLRMSSVKTSGIFADIDFDQLNRNFTPIVKTIETQELAQNNSTEKSSIESKDENKLNDVYDVALPPDASLLVANDYSILSQTTNKTSIKRKKSDKKHKKHKKHKSKHKRHRKASTSSASSSSDIEIKILKHLKTNKK